MSLRLYFDSRLSELIFFWDFEYRERAFLNAFLKPGDVFVDVGAHVGLYTVIAGHLVGATGRVFAFEPASTAHARLLENVALNRLVNVNCWNAALSGQNGEYVLSVAGDGFEAWNSLATTVAGSRPSGERIECLRWDEFATAHDLVDRVAMMKIDVEGWEGNVLAGAGTVLNRQRAPLLQVEFCDQAAAAAGSSCAELYAALVKLGYQVCRWDPGRGLEPDPLRSAYPYDNLFACKDIAGVTRRIRQGHSIAAAAVSEASPQVRVRRRRNRVHDGSPAAAAALPRHCGRPRCR